MTFLGVPSLCMEDEQNYGTEFNITYQTYKSDGLTSEEKIPLKIGENHLAVCQEKVSLTMIYTRWKGICYKVNTTRKADFRRTEIKLNTSVSKTLEKTEFFFTSEENSFGITNNIFMDGKPSSIQLNGGNWKEIYLSVEKNMKLACTKESFFEYAASRLSESNFQNCTHTCLRTSLPIENYPICPNYENWYDNVLKGNLTEAEDDCNWGIVRNLIKDIITDDEHLKTCTTTDYSGQIMTEKNYPKSNELGIKYKFAFPLIAKIHQEFLITDINELVGSVGGMLGLFIGFSFSNLVTCIIGYIGTFLGSRNKLSEAHWASIGWIFYIFLVTTSIWFAWGILDKFFKQDTGIQQHEGNMEAHPTIVICMDSLKYQTDFIILYGITKGDGFSWDYVYLAIGENYLETLKEPVNLSTVYTRSNGLCFAINTFRKIDERNTLIMIGPTSSSLPGSIPVIFTSEMNAYGVTLRDWRDGEVFSFNTSGGNSKQIDLTLEKYVNLKCRHHSFYEYVASRLSEENFEKCNDTCLMTSLPNNLYPICHNYDEWHGNDTKEKESNCNWQILRDLIQNITVNEEHLKTCVTTQYLGKITLDAERTYEHARISYNFALPLKAKVHEEYLITDGITLIGYVGGSLGLFIGFSFSNVIYSIIDFFKSTSETNSSRK